MTHPAPPLPAATVCPTRNILPVGVTLNTVTEVETDPEPSD
jgi:hypothetical protein